MKRLIIALAFAACGSDRDPAPVSELPVVPSPLVQVPTDTIPPEFFGTHFIAIWVSPAEWPAGIGVYRTHDATYRWHMVHTGPGQFYTDPDGKGMARTQSVLYWRNLNAPNAQVIYTLGGGGAVPDGAGGWEAGSHSGIPEWISADTLGAWREYVRAVITEFGDGIDYYEPWNEPNAGNWFEGSPELLLDFTRITFEEVRNLDPTAKVIGPSFTESGHAMMDAFYALGAAEYVDIVGWHHGVINPEADTTRIIEARRILAKHGIDKPLWATEMNVMGGASELVRTYLIHWLYGVEHVGFYSWEMPTYYGGTDGYAHTTASDGTLTDAGVALLQLRDWLVGRAVPGFTADDGRWVVTLNDSSVIEWAGDAMPVRRTH